MSLLNFSLLNKNFMLEVKLIYTFNFHNEDYQLAFRLSTDIDSVYMIKSYCENCSELNFKPIYRYVPFANAWSIHSHNHEDFLEFNMDALDRCPNVMTTTKAFYCREELVNVLKSKIVPVPMSGIKRFAFLQAGI